MPANTLVKTHPRRSQPSGGALKASVISSAVTAVLMCQAARPALAVLDFDDNFANFTAGNLVGQGGWTQLDTASGPLQIQSVGGVNQVVIPANETTNNQDAYKPFSVTLSPGSTLYSGLTLNVNKAFPSTMSSPYYLFGMLDNTTPNPFANARISVRDSDGTGTTGFVFAMRTTGQTPNPFSFTSTVVPYNTNANIIFGWTANAGAGDDTLNLYINPASASVPGTADLSLTNNTTDPANFTGLLISQYATGTYPSAGLNVLHAAAGNDFGEIYNALTGQAAPINDSVISVNTTSFAFGRVVVGASVTLDDALSRTGMVLTTYTAVSSDPTHVTANGGSLAGTVDGSAATRDTTVVFNTPGAPASATITYANTGSPSLAGSGQGADQGTLAQTVSVSATNVVQNRVIHLNGTDNNNLDLGKWLIDGADIVLTGTVDFTTTGDHDNFADLTLSEQGGAFNLTNATFAVDADPDGNTTLFDSETSTATRDYAVVLKKSDNYNSYVTVTATGEGIPGQSVTSPRVNFIAKVYQPAIITDNSATTIDGGASNQVTLTNAQANDNGNYSQRAYARVASITPANGYATDLVAGPQGTTGVSLIKSTAAADGTTIGTVTLDTTGLLNGTYTGQTLAIEVETNDQTIHGAAPLDHGTRTWQLQDLSVTTSDGTGNYTLVNNGSFTDPGATTLTGSFTQTGGTASFGAVTGGGAMTITAGTSAIRQGSGQSVLATLSLTGTGTLDLTDNSLSVTGNDPTAIGNLIKDGYLFSSLSSAQMTLGWASDGASGTLVAFTAFGDANLDGGVNGTDLALLAVNFGGSSQTWATGDFNGDGIVNGTDLALLAGNFGFVAGSPNASLGISLEQASQMVSNVPEPASIALLGLGGLVLAGRRRHA